MNKTSYTVAGMTCGHCADAVTGEIAAIGGVRGVEVDVASGRVTVTSDDPLPVGRVRAAVDEAGFALSAS